jgi:MoaA/NifB/PqqE/SkfB family radical SAM enzyme
MSGLANTIYNAVHTNGLAADLTYRLSYPFKNFWFHLRNWRAVRDKVTPEEIARVKEVAACSSLMIGVTNICNARCVFCAYPRAVDNKDLKAGVMPLPLFKKIVDEWKSLGGDHVDLTHTVGDPLIDPGLVEKIKYATSQGGMKHVSFTTNGILLNRNDTYKRILDAGATEIYISTSGTDKDSYEKTYGVNHYEDMISGVHNLLKYNREKGEPATIAVRFRNGNKPSEIIRSRDFVEKIKPFFSQKVRCNFTVEFDNWGGLIQQDELVGQMRLRKIINDVPVPCRALFGYLIRYDGSVRLCGCRFKKSDMDDMIVGNIQHQSLLDISRSPKAWSIIEGFYQGKRPESCTRCSLYHPINRLWLENRTLTAQQNKQRQIPAERPSEPRQKQDAIV